MRAPRWFQPLSLLLLCALTAPGCGEVPSEDFEAEQGQLSLRLDYLEEEGCAPRPAGAGLPLDTTLVEITLFAAADQEQLQAFSLLVDPLARCADDSGAEFACPFDADRDGLRERFFAFEPVDMTLEVVVVVSLKNELSVPLWSGHSEPFRLSEQGTQPVSVALSSSSEECP